MASVFLSYDREDADRARALAALVERAGHSVWWDRHIRGGAQYSSEIEAALVAADKVVVLWSAKSIASAWVRDEAAVGRDSGRLVPVALDDTEPPLGFRQFQTIDLGTWKGRAKPQQLDELLEALGPGEIPKAPAPGPAPVEEQHRRRPWLILAAVGSVILFALGGWWLAGRSQAHTPVVSVEAASGSARSQQVARELAVRLGNKQSGTNAFRLVSGGGDADLVLQVDASEDRNALHRDVSVSSGKDRSILWSASFQQPAGQGDQIAQQLAFTSQRVLYCGIEALSHRRERIDVPTLKLYLTGCSKLEDVYGLGEYDPSLASLFEQVIAKAPHFEAAWARLFVSEFEPLRQYDPPQKLIDKVRSQIARAEKLGIHIGELYAAKAALLPISDFYAVFVTLNRGIEADPDNAFLYRLMGEESLEVGRLGTAIDYAGQALQLDPLSPALQDNYISILAYAGRIDAAYVQLRKAEAITPGARNLQMARYRLDLRFGDPRAALTEFRNIRGFDRAQESFLEARIDPTPAKIQRAIDEERLEYAQEPRYIAGLLQALAQFGRKDEAIDLMIHYRDPAAIGYNADVLFRPAMREVWRDPRSMAAAAHLGFLRFWQKGDHWPDFCADPTLPYDCKKEAAKYPDRGSK
jgi:tetratricopeptide (TPR) repeat protein